MEDIRRIKKDISLANNRKEWRKLVDEAKNLLGFQEPQRVSEWYNNITGHRSATHCWKQRKWFNIQSTSFRWHITILLRLINTFKEFCHAQHSYISKVTSFSPFYRPPSDLHTRTHERNYTIIYIHPPLPLHRCIKLVKNA